MSSACRSVVLGIVLLVWAQAGAARELRVCADPDNFPLSRSDESGFENRIARLVAQEMGAQLRYEWLPQIRGFVRKTLGAGLCDVFIGVPKDFERVLTTHAYYRSSYVFVASAGARAIASFEDPRLRSLRIGVQLVGNDLAATPPGHALASTGNVDNVRGYAVMGTAPAAQRIVDAIARRELDGAFVWGPQAGHLAAHADPPLDVRVVAAPPGLARMPFAFDIAMGVRRGDRALRDELDGILERRKADIDAILAEYSVPRLDAAGGGAQ